MQSLRGPHAARLDALITIAAVLGLLLIALAVFALAGDVLELMHRFRQQILLFIAGAILAYLLAPLVHRVQRIVRKRWLAVVVSYLSLFLALIILAFLLINPFISQARSLARNLRNPATGSLVSLKSVQTDAQRIASEVKKQQHTLESGGSVASHQIGKTNADLTSLQRSVSNLSAKTLPPGQIGIPPSYIGAISPLLTRLITDYGKAASARDLPTFNRVVADSTQLTTATSDTYAKASSTPILLLNLQMWLDDHGFNVDLHDKFGKALQQLSSQVASLVNNALTIALEAGNLMLNTVLILLISIYFLSDGRRFVNWLISRVPARSRDEAEFFVTSLDRILGSYLRTQVVMALLAATLDATGAVIFGVPYAIVIFFSTFLLSLIPVIGPVILPFPPVLIALVFTPLPRPVFFTLWILAGEQLATNVIGPRLQGHSVGIHPLEAMAAALLGFPIAGFLGSFFAVPAVAFMHVVVRTVLHTRAATLGAESAPAAIQSSVSAGPVESS